jgi:hypothetical protein
MLLLWSTRNSTEGAVDSGWTVGVAKPGVPETPAVGPVSGEEVAVSVSAADLHAMESASSMIAGGM